ncbi:MAG: hypothetical protein NWF07_12745 [Candidatus Bathyarchaeota archaeon]|nr:hypothetical protein [Candidatus Bathyarchaeota archaeon]
MIDKVVKGALMGGYYSVKAAKKAVEITYKAAKLAAETAASAAK